MPAAKSKVEAIFPLTAMQKAFLFHHLQDENDQGLLHVQLRLSGKLNLEFLEKSWQNVANRHGALRTSVHWEKIKKPVQVIHQEVVLPLDFEDLSGLTQKQFKKRIYALKKNKPLDLSKAPVSRINLIKQSTTDYLLLWSCHHLLLDGWSASIIIKDVFLYYDALCKQTNASLKLLPSYKTYFNWLENQNQEEARFFWESTVKKTETSALFLPNSDQPDSFSDYEFSLSEKTTAGLKIYCRQNRITPSTAIKGLWGILLHRYFGADTVTFGTTVSGRSADLPNIDLMAGLFMNVLPVQLEINPEADFLAWVKSVQIEQGKAISFEHSALSQIESWVGNTQSLFDNLLVFENFPWEEMKSGDLTIQDLKGGLTTIYPLTLIIVPTTSFEFNFRYNQSFFDKKTILWFAEGMASLIKNLLSSSDISLKTLLENIKEDSKIYQKQNGLKKEKKRLNYNPPQNELELNLTKIWEKVLNFSPIGATDNFFEIGGKSIHAVRLLSLIENQMNHNLSPAILLQNPTIRKLSNVIKKNNGKSAWSSLVPLRASGSKPPLFCIHGGGAHTFFYKNLIPHLSEEQPVYSLQPLGLDDTSKLHKSAEEMAKAYLREIRMVQPQGPYFILTYCFSVIIGAEINKILQSEKEPLFLHFVIDSGAKGFNSPVNPIVLTYLQRAIRVFTLKPEAIYLSIAKKLNVFYKYAGKTWTLTFGNRQEKRLTKVREHLRSIISNYRVAPFHGKITLIRSAEYTNGLNGLKQERHTKAWSTLALDGVDIYVVDGKHRTLFDEPEVQGLAKQIQICLDDFTGKEDKEQ